MSELRSGPVAQAIRRHRLIIVLRRIEPQDKLLALVEELADSGARAFEITFDAPSAADDIAAVCARLAGRNDGPFIVGAGTITRRDQLDAARASGADFGVAPVVDLELVRAATGAGLPFVPGGMTPSEMSSAWAAGATFVKLFPASVAGPNFIRELHGPFREIEVIPTGGIDASNAQAFLNSGAAAVGVGSAVVRMTPAERRAFVGSLAVISESGL